MKKMMMAVAFATLMAFSMVMMSCGGGEPAPTAATPKAKTPKVTTGGAATSGSVTVAPTPKP